MAVHILCRALDNFFSVSVLFLICHVLPLLHHPQRTIANSLPAATQNNDGARDAGGAYQAAAGREAAFADLSQQEWCVYIK